MATNAEITAAVKGLGLRQRELAAILGHSQQHVARKLSGKTCWTLLDIEALNRHLPQEKNLVITPNEVKFVEDMQVTSTPVTDPGRVLPVDPPLAPPGFTPSRGGAQPQSPEVLNEKRLKAIALRGEGLSQKDIAARLGCSLSSVGNYLRWGRDQGLLLRCDNLSNLDTSTNERELVLL